MQKELDEDMGTEAIMERAVNVAVVKAVRLLDEQMAKNKSELEEAIK